MTASPTTTTTTKAKTEKLTGLPNSAMPKMELPAAAHHLADKRIAQAKDTYENVKATAEEATDLLKDTYKFAVKGATNYNLKFIEIARTNTNSAFDYALALSGIKSLSEFVELSTAHARKQFEMMTAQSKELTELGQKVTAEIAEPIKAGVAKALRNAAPGAAS